MLLIPMVCANAQSSVVEKSTIVQSINYQPNSISLCSTQEDITFELFIVSTTVTKDNEGMDNLEVVFGYKLGDGFDGFASMTILPDGSVITDSSFDYFVTAIQSRSDMLAILQELANMLDDINHKNGKNLGEDTVNSLKSCLIEIGKAIASIAIQLICNSKEIHVTIDLKECGIDFPH